MKVIILCGGLGTRLAEETKTKPKPMVKIGNIPILTHLIKYYNSYGYKEFILATGYKSKIIKDYYKKKKINNSNIKVIYTGKNTLTGGRILRLKKYIDDEIFLVTYGDGLSNVNLKELVNFHIKKKGIVTLTAVRPTIRFGEIKFSKSSKIFSYKEKPQATKNWINGGFFVMTNKIFDFIKNDFTVLEKGPLEKIAKKGKLFAYKHNNFWQCMDTMRDKILLNKLWNKRLAKWKRW